MTNYSQWDAKADALTKEDEEEDKQAKADSDKALGLEGGQKGPTTAKAEAELADLGQHSKKRQEFIDWNKSREIVVTHGTQEQPVELSGDELAGKALRISESKDVTYVLPTGLIKVMLDKCQRVRLQVQGSIITSSAELYRCADIEVELFHPLGTLQVDECTGSVSVRYAEQDHVGRIYHQNSPGLSIGWGGPGCQMHSAGAAGSVQLCTRLSAAGTKEPLITDAVRRDASEYPVEPGAGPLGSEQPEPEAAPAVEERRQRAEQQRQAGNAMFRANDFMQAALHYSESVTLDPTIGAVWANRSQCWLKLGDHEKALADAVRCTEVEPANPKGWFRKGMSLHATKRFAEAIPALLEAEKLEPSNKQVIDAIKMAQMMARKSAAGA